jgi:putative toxin-antitoxin system antitoxin component (TIGR02293 family)
MLRNTIARQAEGWSLRLPVTVRGRIRQVQNGISYLRFHHLSDLMSVPEAHLAEYLGISSRTLERRKAEGKLNPGESERLVRLARLFELAVELFEGDTLRAAQWMQTPKDPLYRESPLSYSRTEAGAREVENLIGRLEHGVFS